MDNNRSGKESSSLRAWLPVVALTFAVFVFNTSEFIPIGLLTDIANDFKMSESQAGLLITVYAWVVGIASLPLMLAASKAELRKLMIGIIVLFIASHLLSAFSTTYSMLMVSRIGVACSHSIFWAIVSPMAVRVAPKGKMSMALGFIITGTSIAMIIGLPLGRVVGLHIGWRMTFFYIAVAATLMLLFFSAIFPKMESKDKMSLRALPALLEKKALVGVFLLTVVFVTGHYTAYSYIEPFLAQVAGLGDGLVTLVLTLFGLVGIGGSVMFSKYYDRKPSAFIKGCVLGVVVMLLLLQVSAMAVWSVFIVCILWGFSITIYNLVFQSEIIQLAPKATAIAMAIYSGIYNVGIGSGALVGGAVCDEWSVAGVGYAGGIISLVAVVYCLKWLLPSILKDKSISSKREKQ